MLVKLQICVSQVTRLSLCNAETTKRSVRIPVAAQAVHSNFKFPGTVSKTHETKHPNNDANRFSANIFDGSDIYSLTVIPQPIPKIYTLYVELGELLPTSSARHEYIEQGILDVAMTPIDTLDAGDGGCIVGQSQLRKANLQPSHQYSQLRKLQLAKPERREGEQQRG